MRGVRLLIAVAAVVAVGVGFVLVRPDDDEPAATTQPTTTPIPPTTEPGPTPTTAPAPPVTTEPAPEATLIVVRVRGGRPLGGIARATANEGDRVVVTVGSDVSDHVHVHGYDLFADVRPGAPARISFQATLTGRFEIELEDRGRQIAQLTVVP
jgi:hypothetical protein